MIQFCSVMIASQNAPFLPDSSSVNACNARYYWPFVMNFIDLVVVFWFGAEHLLDIIMLSHSPAHSINKRKFSPKIPIAKFWKAQIHFFQPWRELPNTPGFSESFHVHERCLDLVGALNFCCHHASRVLPFASGNPSYLSSSSWQLLAT